VHPRLPDERRELPLRLRQWERNNKENNDGGIKMNRKRIFTLAFAVLMLLALAACGTKNNDKMGDMSGNGSAMTGEAKNAEEALAMHKELMAQENALLSEKTELWEKVFMAADKGMTMQEDGKNYGDFLLKTIEDAKEEFSDEEYEWLKKSATEISNIESKLTKLEEKYPEIMQKSMDGDMSVPAGSDMTTPPDDGSMQKFPAFDGKDLDGNTVKSDELFSANAVTVVNFWFTTCNPCVGELGELDALNKELANKGGALIGINTFTLDGDEKAIAEAKDVLAKKGATYQNVYFDSDGEAGKFTTNIFAYPTTYVVDRSGNIVGEPIVGAITEKKQSETLQKLIDQALAADMG
jgi:thiol-disulfide isomerase/thioredoxin